MEKMFELGSGGFKLGLNLCSILDGATVTY